MFRPHIAICICHNLKRLIVVKAGLCQEGNEARKNKANKKPAAATKPRKPIKRVSDKRQKLNALYSILRTQFLKDHPTCQAQTQCQRGESTDIHHKKGRGPYLLDTSTWLASCRKCHVWIEQNPEKAKELSLSQSRLTKNK